MACHGACMHPDPTQGEHELPQVVLLLQHGGFGKALLHTFMSDDAPRGWQQRDCLHQHHGTISAKSAAVLSLHSEA